MSYRNLLSVILISIFVFPGSAWAVNSVLSGDFDGSEDFIEALEGTCSGADELAYRQTDPFQVSASGNYTITDAFNFFGVDISANIYAGNFNPNAPAVNLVTADGVDVVEDVMLSSGTNYILVVQRWCLDPDRVSHFRDGAWAVTFSGPGAVTSGFLVDTPSWTEGTFLNGDPTANTDCGNSRYHSSGPVQVMRSGTYYYADYTYDSAQPVNLDVCVQVYTAPFNPANPDANRVGSDMDDLGLVDLEAATDYYFVVQPIESSDVGDYFFILAPPEIRISIAMAGSWFDPPTAGQGFFFDVFEERNQMNIGWYTYDLERPDQSVEALMGDPGHRWLTAQGPFSGDTATLTIYWTSGMIFDSADPPKSAPVRDGTIEIQFFDCYTGQITYEIESVSAMGVIAIERIAEDAIALCKKLSDGPGQPGPL